MEDRVLGGRYVVSGLLGRGGMAEVHLAHDLRLDRPVAVKLLRPDIAVDPTFLARFRREALSAASLNHPGVVAVYDCGEDTAEGVLLPYLVMEYVRGSTLAELLAEEAPLPVREALELTGGVLDALATAHAQGIVHRDIKPANVMLTGDGRTKVMDFGIARPMNTAATALTQPAMVIGTADYLSPEQAGGRTVDTRSDLYSTGCLLYELLTGRPPFTGGTPMEVAWARLRTTPEPPSARAPALTADCDRLVLRALAQDPDQRFQSATEMRGAVDAALRGLEPAAAGHPALSAVPSRASAATPSAVSSTLPLAARQRAPRPAPAPTRVERAVRPRRRRGRTVAIAVGAVLLSVGGAVAVARNAGVGTTAGTSPRPAQAVVPDLGGRTLLEARLAARGSGLQVGAVVQGGCTTAAVVPRHVCGQFPASGGSAARGSRITVHLSPATP
ncbi:protein kinase [Streptacidiphilus sp. EB129]|uniref:protein kinase domain-containing protein n=1 Tax=Streptacidiphilus sp. EB129 TaxID=3156262 RepID=UPI00351852EC